MSEVWRQSKAKGSGLLVLLAIADFCIDEGFSFPSVKTLSRKARLSHRQTQRAIKHLCHTTELRVLSGQGPHGTSLYQVTLCQGDKMSGVTPMAERGDILRNEGVTRVSPNPSNHRTIIERPVTPHTSLEGETATEEWIIEQWRLLDGGVVQPREITPLLRTTIKSRIREHQTKTWWKENFFSLIRESDFLNGKTDGNFHANLGWALGPKNLAKILEGRYTNSPKKRDSVLERIKELERQEREQAQRITVVNP